MAVDPWFSRPRFDYSPIYFEQSKEAITHLGDYGSGCCTVIRRLLNQQKYPGAIRMPDAVPVSNLAIRACADAGKNSNGHKAMETRAAFSWVTWAASVLTL
jgi:hypothetical protein